MSADKRFAPAVGLLLIAGAIFVAVSLFSYQPGDAGHAGAGPVYNYGGRVGAQVALYLLLVLGYGAWALPAALLAEGCFLIFSSRSRPFVVSLLYELAALAAFSGLWGLKRGVAPRALGWQLERVGWGGFWGREASGFLLSSLGLIGARIILLTVFVLSVLLLTDMKPLYWSFSLARGAARFVRSLLPSGRMVKVGRTPSRAAAPAKPNPQRADEARRREREELLRKQEELKRKSQELEELKAREKKEAEEKRRREEEEAREKARAEKERRGREAERERERAKQEKQREAEAARRRRAAPAPAPVRTAAAGPGGPYRLPPADLLIKPPPLADRALKDDIEVNSKILESTLQDFGIEAKVVGAERGPAITRYELQPAPGVKVQKVKTLDNDIALAMKAVSIRILAPIPGKAAIGIEVPNSSTALVYAQEMIESEEFRDPKHVLPLALGKDIAGKPLVADLTDMPHLLIAGATGSGKTVCMNAVITSLLFARTPDELKLILVDPKKVEMTAYGKLPHLLCPVVTDAVKTSLALSWLVREMEQRYDLFSRVGARNIEGYNHRAAKDVPLKEGEEPLPPTIPYILLMIDELADLMLAAQTEIENQIARLAHLSRAVGIHMILATQRPSVDVITGVIKANFPARLSFKVSAKVDSRTVLDTSGADKLLGNGDLLFLPPGTSRLVRAQGTLCHDSEIEAVVGFVNRQREPQFRAEILQRAAGSGAGGIALGGGEDILLEAAVEVIKQTGRASVSVLQRKLKIGYGRASRIVDILEEKGIVGPFQGSKEREVLIDTYAGSDDSGGEDGEE